MLKQKGKARLLAIFLLLSTLGVFHNSHQNFLDSDPRMKPTESYGEVDTTVNRFNCLSDEVPLTYNPIHRLTDNSYSDTSPQIHNGQVTWAGHDGSDNEIFFWNGTTTSQLTNNTYAELEPQIWDGEITWRGHDGSDYEIFFWNGSTTTPLTNNTYDDVEPRIHDGQVTWRGLNGSDWEIYLWNGTSVLQLTDNDYYDSSPRIHDGKVTWVGSDGNDFEIYLWNGTSTRSLTDNVYDDESPKIHKGGVTWLGYDGYDYEIYFWNGYTTIQLTDDVYDEEEVQFHNGQVTWVESFFFAGKEICVSLDHPPEINHPMDLVHELGTTGHTITWKSSDLTPASYNVTQDNELVAEGPWNGGSITINIDGLDVASYNFSCQVWDVRGESAEDTVIVTVQETTLPPSWKTPPTDQTIEYGTDLEYQLSVTDHSGIDAWVLNDTTYFGLDVIHYTGGSTVNISSMGILELGVYPLKITVNDTFGNPLIGEFTVTVQDTTPPTWTTPPADQLLELGSSFVYDLDATDSFGLIEWSVNDTVHFAIDSNGVITNNTVLPVGIYGLLVSVSDTNGNMLQETFSVQLQDTTSPVWTTVPSDQLLEYGEDLDYQLHATDLSGIAQWTVNDTTHFSISSTGRLTNVESFSAGTYGVEITVQDQYGNSLIASISITVADDTTTTTTTTPTDATSGPPTTTLTGGDPAMLIIIVVGCIGVVIVIVFTKMKQSA